MKLRVLNFLVCPACKTGLEIEIRSSEGPEITEGTLSCRSCSAGYPILRGVPRFVKEGAYASSFGCQWNWFRTVQIDSLNGTKESERTLAESTGWKDGDYQGRLALDAGIGAGRFAEIVARKGGEVVGIDLTAAVDAAYCNIGRHERAHIVQADIFAMPFREGTFDLAYSIGVLHHTPDPRAAFARVASMVGKDGALAVYLYDRYGPFHRIPDAIRQVTTRLPMPMMLAVSALAIPLYFLYRLPLLGPLLRIFYPISMHPNWRWRWLDTLDWYTPKYQWKFLYPEVCRWFRENGFLDLELFDGPIRMRGIKSVRANGARSDVKAYEGLLPETEARESFPGSLHEKRDHAGATLHR